MPTYATKANMDKYFAKHGHHLVMYSPYTGEQYSANPEDYWNAPKAHRFKDSSGRVMLLGTAVPATVAPLRTRKPAKKRSSKGRR